MNNSLSHHVISASTAILISFAILYTPVSQAEVSVNLTATSNYMDRGATQSNNSMAIQGGLDFTQDSGMYIGTWASSLDGVNGYEQDLYLGYTNAYNSINYDIGYVYYIYPTGGPDVNDLSEIYASLGYMGLTLGMHYSVTETEKGSQTGDVYTYIGYEQSLTDKIGFSALLGHQQRKEADGDNYNHLQFNLTAGDFILAYDQALKAESGGVNKDNPVLSISYSKTFIVSDF